MRNEQIFFLSVLSDYINQTETELCQNINWQTILDYSRSHQLTAIFYHQCKSFIPDDVINEFKSSWSGTIFNNTKRRTITSNIITELKKTGINCFLVKGSFIANFYPHWHYRTMGDSDIVVDDIDNAHSVMVKNGFDVIKMYRDTGYQYSKAGMEYELHSRLIYDQVTNIDATTEFINNFQVYLVSNQLDDSFHFIFILSHLRKHFMNGGVGFRQFFDIAMLIKYDKDLKWIWIEHMLDEIGLLQFSKNVFCYIDRWFDVTAPIASSEVSEKTFEVSTEYVFDNGVFGYDNEDNKNSFASNTVRKSKHPRLKMIILAINKVFPSYKSMSSSEDYSFLRGKPILLPFAGVSYDNWKQKKRNTEG